MQKTGYVLYINLVNNNAYLLLPLYRFARKQNLKKRKWKEIYFLMEQVNEHFTREISF